MSKSCYVSMPFGRKPHADGALIDFDAIYVELIQPAVVGAGLSCERGDDSELGAIIQKGILRLVLQSDLMIADVTTVNPNVIYDVGIRFATHPRRTILLDGGNVSFPFSLNLLPRLRYALRDGRLDPAHLSHNHTVLTTAVRRAMDSPVITSPVFDLFPHLSVHLPRDPCVFIGHGRSKLWIKVKEYLEGDLKLSTVSYESESRVGQSIAQALEAMLARASFAVLLMTAEDLTDDKRLRARQNVIHEAGLFQGSLGFARAIVLRQDDVEEFSNIAGLQHIAFAGEAIEQTFSELQRVLKREGVLATQDAG